MILGALHKRGTFTAHFALWFFDTDGGIIKETNVKQKWGIIMNEFITAVSTVGFPIACCCFLLWQNTKQDEYNRKQQEELRKTIENNTKSIKDLANLVRDLAEMIKGN